MNKLKEIRLRANTQQHDINVKKRQIERFLKAGDKVRISISLRGRENAHTDLAITLMQGIVSSFTDTAGADSEPRVKGNIIEVVLSPRKQG